MAAGTAFSLLPDSRFSRPFQVFNIFLGAPDIKLSTRRLVNEEDSTFMRKNSRFGNYQATQAEDKSQKVVGIYQGESMLPGRRGCVQGNGRHSPEPGHIS